MTNQLLLLERIHFFEYKKHKFFRISFLFLLVFISYSFKVYSQSADIQAIEVKSSDNRHLPRALKVVQDTNGLIWISEWPAINTQKEYGLFRHDGFRTKEIDISKSKPAHFKAVECSNSGFLYLAFRDSLSVFDPYKKEIVENFSFSDSSKNHIKNSYEIIYAFGEYSQNMFAIAVEEDYKKTLEYHLLKVNSQGELEYFKSLDANSNQFFKVAISNKSGVFAIDGKSVNHYDFEGKLIERFSPEGLGALNFHSIAQNENGDLFLMAKDHSLPASSKNKLNVKFYYCRASEFSWQVIDIPIEETMKNYTNFYPEGSNLWLLGSDFLLAKYNMTDKELLDYGAQVKEELPDMDFFFLSNQIYNLFKDRSGAYWLSSVEGLIKFSILPKELNIYQGDGLNCIDDRCSMRGISEDSKGNIFISYQGGIGVLTTKEKKLLDIPLEIEEVDLNEFYSLTAFNGFLYWGDHILNLENGDIKSLLPNKKNPRVIHYLDSTEGMLWLMVNMDISTIYSYSLKDEKLRMIPLDLEHTDISEIHQVSIKKPENHIVILSGEEFAIVDKKGRTIKNLSKIILNDKKGAHGVLNFEIVDNRYLWSSSFVTNSIFRIDLKKDSIDYEVKLNKTETSLKTMFYSMIYENENRIWFSLGDGLGLLDISQKKFQKLKDIPRINSLEFNRPSVLKDSKGILWFGSTNGLISFDPQELLKEKVVKSPFRATFSDIEYFDPNLGEWTNYIFKENEDGHIFLNHDQSSLNIEFYLPDYKASEKLLFTHWLEGLESGYSLPNNLPRIEYSNLQPGDYKLHIRGGLNQDLFETSERVLHIHIAQAWYKTYWAIASYILLFILLTYLIYRFQLNRQKEKETARYLLELDQFKSGFFTNITHEFRSPLTVILGLANEIDVNNGIRDQIIRNGQRLLNLINQILDLSKLEEGKLKLENKRIEVMAFSKYLIDSFRTPSNEKGLTLQLSTNPDQLWMDLDEEKFQVIVTNLLSNAIKFSPENAVIHISVNRKNSELVLKVEDEGSGIPDDQLEKIFDRFYQVEGSKNVKIGSGVGLALSKELVRLMGGRIVAANSSLGGAVFEVALPITNEGLIDEETQILKVQALSPIPNIATDDPDIEKVDKQLVLIVEDEPDIRSFIRRCLESKYSVIEAINGEEGFAKTIEFIPDLLISDVMMPKMDGLELTEKVKNDKRTSHIPIIILSAKTSLSSRLDGLKRGAEVYLAKPFEKEELLLQINNLFSLRTKIQSFLNDGIALDLPEEVHVEEHHFISSLKAHLEENLDDSQFGVEQLCEMAAMSRTQLHRKLTALTGMSATKFINSYKLSRACEMLLEDRLNISEIAYTLGYSDPNYFTRLFQKTYGKSPSEFKSFHQS